LPGRTAWQTRLAERAGELTAYAEMPVSEKSVVHLNELEQRLATEAGKHETGGSDPVNNE
jgi:hypothetical protein